MVFFLSLKCTPIYSNGFLSDFKNPKTEIYTVEKKKKAFLMNGFFFFFS